MTKYHAHEAVIATGPDTGNLPDAGDFHAGMPAELHPLIVGPVRAPGEQGGVRYASYVFMPEGKTRGSSPPSTAMTPATCSFSGSRTGYPTSRW